GLPARTARVRGRRVWHRVRSAGRVGAAVDARHGLARESRMARHETLVAEGREVRVSNPDKVLFPEAGHTKLDLVRYYLAVAEGALRAAGGRPNVLVRYPNGIDGEHFYQKRAPASR